jgi:hypothetical protein
LPMGMSGGTGGIASGLPMICAMRRNDALGCGVLIFKVLTRLLLNTDER